MYLIKLVLLGSTVPVEPTQVCAWMTVALKTNAATTTTARQMFLVLRAFMQNSFLRKSSGPTPGNGVNGRVTQAHCTLRALAPQRELLVRSSIRVLRLSKDIALLGKQEIAIGSFVHFDFRRSDQSSPFRLPTTTGQHFADAKMCRSDKSVVRPLWVMCFSLTH